MRLYNLSCDIPHNRSNFSSREIKMKAGQRPAFILISLMKSIFCTSQLGLYSIILSFVLFPLALQSQVNPSKVAVRTEIDSLIQVNKRLADQQQYEQALEVIGMAKEKAEAAFGKKDTSFASAVFFQALSFQLKGEYDKAEPLYKEVMNIRKELLGTENLDYANTVNNLANVYISTRRYEAAVSLHLEAKGIRARLVGEKHPDHTSSLNNLGQLYKFTGQLEKSEQFLLEAVRLRGEAHGKESKPYIQSANNLANLYDYYIGDYLKAEAFYTEVKDLHAKMLGKESAPYALTLSNLGSLFYYAGDYDKAEPYLLEANEIQFRVQGADNVDYANTLTDLANLYADQGRYEESEQLYRQVLDLYRRLEGAESLNVAIAQQNLAVLYVDLNNLQEAINLYEAAAEVEKKLKGRETPEYAQSLNNLAVMYDRVGQLDKSEVTYLEAKEIREKILGKRHPDVASNLWNLAALYEKQGKLSEAEAYYLEAEDIRREVLGVNHPDYAVSLSGLGSIKQRLQEYEKAEQYFLKAQQIRLSILGENHPSYAKSLNELSDLYWDMGNLEKTDSFLNISIPLERSFLINASRFTSENELEAYIQRFKSNLNRIYSLAQTYSKLSPEGKMASYESALFHKGFLLNAASQLRKLSESDSTSTELFAQLQKQRRQLAEQYSYPLEWQTDISKLEGECDSLERVLARQVAGVDQALRQTSAAEILEQLKPGEAAIEFVHYDFVHPDLTDSVMYAALILQPGKESPAFVPLFESRDLSKLVNNQQGDQASNVNRLYGRVSRGVKPKKRTPSGLKALDWKPLLAQLEGIHTIYYAPSGLLHRINFAAVPINDKEILADRYRLVQLNSTRQLVFADRKSENISTAFLMGGIQYDGDPSVIPDQEQQEARPSLLASGNGMNFQVADRNMRNNSWQYLYWTDQEVTVIDSLLDQNDIQSTLLKGSDASEDAFREMAFRSPSPTILHLATHGFFFSDPREGKSEEDSLNSSAPVFQQSLHPMIRSGLVIAGGNDTWLGKSPSAGGNDGILTAYEISQMDLSDTELVVLSACETGLGDIQGNEGVYGLQRAFKIAGAQYLIMSLWQIPDRETMEFMTTFYLKWLRDKQSIPEAFRLTQKVMRERYPDPFVWAGFVLVE